MFTCGDRQVVVFSDLTEALPEGGRDFSIQDLQNCFYIFPGCISAQIAGKQAEEVCEGTHTHTHIHTDTVSEVNQLYHRKLAVRTSDNVNPVHNTSTTTERKKEEETK